MKTMRLMGLMIVGGLLSGGCTHFPTGSSLDKHMYVSTPEMPLSLKLLDTSTGEVVWSLDVPIYKKAVIDLDHDDKWTPAQTPHIPATEIKWGIFEPDSRFGQLENSQKLSGNPVLLKVSIREAEEQYTLPTEPAKAASE